jgi:hypothetical protein
MRTQPHLLAFACLALSPAAFAYHHPSSGTGLACSLTVSVRAASRPACAARIVSSKHIDVDGVDVNGHRYQTVDRFTDTAACLDDGYSARGTLHGDASRDLGGQLGLELEYASSDAGAVYRSGNGTIDAESNARGDITYVNYDPTPAAEAREKALLQSIVAQLASTVAVEYDATAKMLTLTAGGARGSFRSTQPSDLSVGSLKSAALFTLPAGEITPDGRSVEARIGCGAL